jgi:hypothetical protein
MKYVVGIFLLVKTYPMKRKIEETISMLGLKSLCNPNFDLGKKGVC